MINFIILHFCLYLFVNDVIVGSFILNIISHSLVILYSLYAIYNHDNNMDKIYDKSENSLIIIDHLQNYFAYDLLVMIYTTVFVRKINYLYYIHHISVFLILEMLRDGFLHYYVPIIAMFELSSIPLNLRYLMLEIKYSKKIIRKVEICFFVTFISIRCFYGMYYCYDIINLLLNENLKSKNHLYIPIGFFGLLFLLHVTWIRGIYNKIKKNNKKKTKDNIKK